MIQRNKSIDFITKVCYNRIVNIKRRNDYSRFFVTREWKEGDNMKEILLTNSEKTLMVDDEDFKKMAKHTYYYKASTGYAFRMEKDKETGKWKHILAQRDVFPYQYCRFRDTNRLNCQKENIRRK